MEWISVNDDTPDCEDWDIDREAFFSKKVMTFSSSHGISINYYRKDDIYVESFMRHRRQTSLTYKWGVSGDDKTITHWMELPKPPTEN